ncbi:MAG: ATP-binding protein [Gammaproteobacteria bacterium]
MPLSEPSAILAGLDATRYGLALWSADQRLVFCNQAFRNLYHSVAERLQPGLAYRDFLQALLEAAAIVQPHDSAEWITREINAFGTAPIIEQNLGDGRVLEITQDFETTGAVVMAVTDVTVAKRGERALRRAKELAEAADQAKSRFLRAANHDLRQPLSTLKILIYSCMDEDDPTHRRDLLHAMDISVSIMEDLLGALLQIGQLDAGKIVPRITTFQLSQVLDRLKIQFAHQASEKGLELKFVDTRASISSDKALLERILSNLIANAIRYTEHGVVLVGCRKAGARLRIEVWDTGKGIEADHIDRIFDEFYQVNDAKRPKHRGLGLGLNIVKRLAELLDHEITVHSTPRRGSVFSVTVPIGNVWQSEMGEPVISEMIGGEFAGIPVLLIEDDGVLRQAAKDLLERWGLIVHALSSYEEAKELIAVGGLQPGLIISDYSLRGQHGTDVVTHIRALLGQDVPCIIVTADTDPRLIERLKAQSFPVLIKPVSPPRLRVLMHNLLYEPSLEQRGAPV